LGAASHSTQECKNETTFRRLPQDSLVVAGIQHRQFKLNARCVMLHAPFYPAGNLRDHLTEKLSSWNVINPFFRMWHRNPGIKHVRRLKINVL
jgi:hypothetical protein